MASWSIHENKEVTSKYQILGHIGSGSYADVYRGLRKADDLQVALKEVHDYQSACREIRALLRLRGHPNVVQLLDYLWLSDDSVVLVLEFLVSDLTVVIHRLRKQQQPKAISHLGQQTPFEINLRPCETYPCLPYLLDTQGIQYMVSDVETRTHLWAAAAPDGSNDSFHVDSYRTAPPSYDVYNTEAAHMLAADDAFETDAPSRNIVAAASKACSHQEASAPVDAAIEVASRVNDIAATIGDMGVTSNDLTRSTLDVETSAPSITVAKSSTAGNANDMEAASAEGQQQDILAAAFDSAEAEIKGWMIQLLRGVASCHSVGVLHRDLKPSNMLISTSGILKVADFGQARILEPPLCHVEEFSLPIVTNVDDVSRPEAPESREGQSRIVSTIATFHTETMDKSMEVEDIDTASQPLFIKGFAKRQSHENLLHVNPSSEEINISKLLPDSETRVPKHITDEDVRTMIGATNSKGTEGTVDSFVRDVHLDDFKIIGKALPIWGAIDSKTCIPQQCDGSADGVEDRQSFGSADADDPRQVVLIDSDADSMWIHRDLTRPEWDVGGNYNDVPWGIDEAVSERSAEFSGSEPALNKEDVGSEFTGCVGTRWYRAPELLYGATCYGMRVDMWAVGCIFGELLLGQPIFPGCSDIDQLSRIVRALGNPNEECWPGVSNLPDYGKILFADDRSFSLQQHVKQGSEEAHDLLNRLVCYDPGSRLSADDALKHPFFHVQPHPMPVSELRVPSPGPVVDDDEDAMHSF